MELNVDDGPPPSYWFNKIIVLTRDCEISSFDQQPANHVQAFPINSTFALGHISDSVSRPSASSSLSSPVSDFNYFSRSQGSTAASPQEIIHSSYPHQMAMPVTPIKYNQMMSDYADAHAIDTQPDGKYGLRDHQSQSTEHCFGVNGELHHAEVFHPVSPIANYDWTTFVSAYAHGRWDPHRPPLLPQSSWPKRSSSTTAESQSRPTQYSHSNSSPPFPLEGGQQTSPDSPNSPPKSSIISKRLSLPQQAKSRTSNHPFSTQSSSARRGRLPNATQTNIHARRLGSSFSTTSNFSTNSNFSPVPAAPDSSLSFSLSNNDVHTSVATMRWAAARVDLSPLALPSPEHELTDPMRGVTASIPGSHSEVLTTHDLVTTPGGTRRSRLSSFWQGTQAVETDSPTSKFIQHNPLQSPKDNSSPQAPISRPELTLGESSLSQPSSAPGRLNRRDTDPLDDYFSGALPSLDPTTRETQSSASMPNPRSPMPIDPDPLSISTFARRLCLTRQAPSPLSKFQSSKENTDSRSLFSVSRMAQEERMFADLGYLVPPIPPDEPERRRALYKYAFPALLLTLSENILGSTFGIQDLI